MCNAQEHRANTCLEESRKLDYRDVLAESEDKQFSKEGMKRYTLCRSNGRVEVWWGLRNLVFLRDMLSVVGAGARGEEGVAGEDRLGGGCTCMLC